jgi:hypothetical protein
MEPDSFLKGRFMQREELERFKKNFLLAWVIANALGVSIGWVTGEWFGLRAAAIWSWTVGQVIGFMIYEGSIWACRSTVLSRIQSYDVLKPIEVYFWVSVELILWFGMRLGGGDTPYRAESLFGVVSVPIMATCIGVIGWLILWLIKMQRRKPRVQRPSGWSLLASFGWIAGSLFIYFFLVFIMPLSTSAGEAAAKFFSQLGNGKSCRRSLVGWPD